MLKTSNLPMMKKDIQLTVRKMIEERNDNLSEVEMYLSNCQKIKNLYTRLFFFVLGIFCFGTAIYQIYDRISYFLTIPLITITTENVNIGKLHPFRLERFQTDELQPYWKLIRKKNERRCPFTEAIFRNLNKTGLNFSEFWAATNITPYIRNVKIKMENKLFGYIKYNNGHIVEANNSKILKLHDKLTYFGSTTIFKLEKTRKEASISVDLFHTGFCPNPTISFVMEHLLPYYYFIMLYFGRIVHIKYSIRKNIFLNTPTLPCESNKIVAKKCLDDCLVKKYQELECRFPFVPIEVENTDCNLKDNVVVLRVYQQCLNIIFSTNPTFNCSCKKSCVEEKIYIKKTIQVLNDTKMFSVEYSKMDINQIELLQQKNYDLLKLLSDIAGSLGLFLGLSLLSIVKSVRYGSYLKNFLPRNRKNKCNKLQNDVIEKLFVQISKTKSSYQKYSIFRKYFIQSGLFFISLFLIVEKIIYFSSIPTHTLIILVENETMYLPNLISCYEDINVINLKKKFALENNINICQVHFLDLLDIKINPPKIKNLWPIGRKSSNVLKGGNYKMMNTETIHGICDEYNFHPRPFTGSASLSQMIIRLYEGCLDKISVQFFIKDIHTSIHTIYKNQLDIFGQLISDIMVETFFFERHNSIKKPCTTNTQFEKCKQHCFEKKINDSNSCRLPFTNFQKNDLCINGTDAKKSLTNYLYIVLHTDIYKDCNCLLQCKEVVYKTHWTYAHFSFAQYTQVFISPLTNMIEISREIPSYSYVALFCDFGNIFGITLGMSLLSVFLIALTKSSLLSNI